MVGFKVRTDRVPQVQQRLALRRLQLVTVGIEQRWPEWQRAIAFQGRVVRNNQIMCTPPSRLGRFIKSTFPLIA